MVLNMSGESMEINGVTYAVGMDIIGTSTSEYEGLYGQITEIRTDIDIETENDGPDIYCSFNPPADITEITKVEAVFTELYGVEKHIGDIIFDSVIMAAGMIAPA